MGIFSIQEASRVAADLLRGTQFDSIRAYSLIVQLGFIRVGSPGSAPGEAWVSVSGNLACEGTLSKGGERISSSDFFESRRRVLGEAFRLIGSTVTAVDISDSGDLRISFGELSLVVRLDDECALEEVWAVMGDTPDTRADHAWYVSCDQSGVLSGRHPA